MFRFLLWAILAALKPKALLVAENLCLRQQLLVLQRRQPGPYLKTADRLFWVLEATDRPSCNSPTASGAHPTNGRGKQTLGPKANTG